MRARTNLHGPLRPPARQTKLVRHARGALSVPKQSSLPARARGPKPSRRTRCRRLPERQPFDLSDYVAGR
jgi:hypothetical protein